MHALFVSTQGNYAQESTQRMLLVNFVHRTVTPIVAAYAMVASYPYPCNSPAVTAAHVKRVEKLALGLPSSSSPRR